MSDPLQSLREALRGRYDPERVLGQGGMATVYLARDVKHNRAVAVKVLKPELAASLAVNRFLKEIEIAAQLNHPHILPLLDSGDVNGVLHFVMPFVEGRSLRGLLHEAAPMSLATALTLTREVAGALSYAHRKGIVHRDIKPENILLSEGHAVVADFGIAKAISTAGGANLTRTGFPLGTLGYMSPEQAAGRSDLDETTDVYSLASVFYEMMVGDTPGMWVTDEAMRFRRFVDALPDHRERLDALPGSLEQVLVKAMALRPEQRFTDPYTFATALENATHSPPQFDEEQVRAVIQYAADKQAERPTEDAALSLGTVQRIGAEVGLSPDRIDEAVAAVGRNNALTDAPRATDVATGRRGGLLGASPTVELERVVDAELPPEEFEMLLEEIRAAMGEVGRINETLGQSLSWNSLSFQHSLEGSGRLVHIMVKPKPGQTRVRITESAGSGPFFVVAAPVMGGGLLGLAVGSAVLGAGAPLVLSASVLGAAIGGTYLASRTLFAAFIRRRRRFLTSLMDRLDRHITATGRVTADTSKPGPGDRTDE